MSFAANVAAVEALWASRWTPVDGVRIIWNHNGSEAPPSRRDTANWLHLGIEFGQERIVAYGGGPSGNQWERDGFVRIKVFSARGAGEVTQLELLDAAVEVFRAQRVPPLTIIGSSAHQIGGATDDGGWWVRGATCSFLYRFAD